jgi:hypothetical protein
VVLSFAVVALLAHGTGGTAAATPERQISRAGIGGGSIGMTLSEARARWGRPSYSFAKPHGVTFVWLSSRMSVRFKGGIANEVSAVVTGTPVRTRFGDRAGTPLSTVKRHFPGGLERRTCCWVRSYAIPARARGYVLAFTFNSKNRLERAELTDARSYRTCFHTSACD